MRVILYNIKRILNGKLNLILFVIPIIAVSIFVMIFNASTEDKSDVKAFSDCKVGVVDLDKTEYTEDLIEYLNTKYSIRIIDEEKLNSFLIKNKLNYAVKFKEGTTEKLIKGEEVEVEGRSLKEGSEFQLFNEDLNFKIQEAKAVGSISENETVFYENLDKIEDGSFKVDNKIDTKDKSINYVGNAMLIFWGFIVFFLIYFNCNIGQRFLEDKLSNKIERIKTTDYSYGKYVISLAVSQIILGLIQVSILCAVINLIGGEEIKSLFNTGIIVILFLANLTGLSLSILISAVSKSKNMFLAILNIAVNVLAMLGGLYWPLDVMPKFVLNISRCIPTYWLRTALNMSLKGNAVSEYSLNLCIIVLFSIAFIFISIFKERKLFSRLRSVF